jgi:superfamily II DNA or RNA helicase
MVSLAGTKGSAVRFAYLSGQDSGDRRRRILAQFRQGQVDIVITSVIWDEGVDAPNIENLILAGGGRAPHRQIQRIGRGMRKVAGKDRLTVIDFADRGYYLGRQANSRRRAYQKEKAYTTAEVRPEEIEQWLQ